MLRILRVSAPAVGLVLLLLRPEAAAAGATEGLTLTLQVLLPSLFPFMVLTDMLTGLSLPGTEGRAASFLLGFAGGYPTGARLVCGLYSAGKISRPEAEWRLSWCSNCGIGFLFGTVAAGLLGRPGLGLPLLLIQAASALCCALLLRPKHLPPQKICRGAGTAAPFSLSAALLRGARAMVGVGASVVFLSALLSAIQTFLPPLPAFLSALLSGLGELSLGARAAAALPAGGWLLCALCGFGGMCVHLQCLGFISAAGLSPRRYWAGKLLQGLLAGLLGLFFCMGW